MDVLQNIEETLLKEQQQFLEKGEVPWWMPDLVAKVKNIIYDKPAKNSPNGSKAVLRKKLDKVKVTIRGLGRGCMSLGTDLWEFFKTISKLMYVYDDEWHKELDQLVDDITNLANEYYGLDDFILDYFGHVDYKWNRLVNYLLSPENIKNMKGRTVLKRQLQKYKAPF